MNLIELILDETMSLTGIDAISLVEHPAIEEDFIALNSQKRQIFAMQNKEKRLLMGAALIPDKPIYRTDGENEYYVYFSKETVRKAMELFFKNGYQNNATIEHDYDVDGTTIVESWIIEDETLDKSRAYGLDLPVGTWMVSMKIDNENIWRRVKDGEFKGFSIEGYFVDKMNFAKQDLAKIEEQEAALALSQIVAIIKNDGRKKSGKRVEMESFADYPEAVRNNAKRGIELNEKGGNKCATAVGKLRGQQLAQGKPLSIETITRMHSYLSRAETYYDEGNTQACGTISYLLWGGLAGKRWAESKLKELGKLELKEGVPHYTADGKLYTGPTHKDADGRLMTGATHTEDSEYLYHKDELAEVGERGGIKESEKAPKSDTPNKDPKGEGTAKGDASDTRGAEVTKRVEEILQKKGDDFNERYKDKLGYGVTIGMLKTVYQRGVGAFNTSHSPEVSSAEQWALARVNAFLYLIKEGRPENEKYTTDYDLLPAKHPKSNKQ